MEKVDLSVLGIPDKEQKILEAAVGIFEKKGFSAATTSEIAKEAGVAEGTIFRYFKTKKDILRGILVNVIKLVSEKVVLKPIKKILNEHEGKSLRNILKELIYDRIELIDRVFPMAKVILMEAMLHEDVKEAVYENIIKKAIEVFSNFYDEMAKEGLIRTDIPLVILVRTIIANIAGYIAQKKILGELLPTRPVEEEIDCMLDIILQGIEKKREGDEE